MCIFAGVPQADFGAIGKVPRYMILDMRALAYDRNREMGDP